MSKDLDDIFEVGPAKDRPKQALGSSSGSSTSQSASEATYGLVFAVVFYVVSVIFVVVGFVVTYQDSSYETKIVGGDAYNYIIFAGRGIVWVGAAVVASIFGLGCQLAGHVSRLRRALNRITDAEAV